MAIEIERKFLVTKPWPKPRSSVSITQGYLTKENGVSVRVRCKGEAYWLTLKAKHQDAGRYEFEYAIPIEDGRILLRDLCAGHKIEKTRHEVLINGILWEIDVFSGLNEGLIIAEVELEKAEQVVDLPDWIGPEVTGDARFMNASLARFPFTTWGVSYDDLLSHALSESLD